MHSEDRSDLGNVHLARPLGLWWLGILWVSVALMGFASNPHLRILGALFEGLGIGILLGPSLAIWVRGEVTGAAGSSPAVPAVDSSAATELATDAVIDYVVDFLGALAEAKLTPVQQYVVRQVVRGLPEEANIEMFLRACRPDALGQAGIAAEHAALLEPFVKQLEDHWAVLSNCGFFLRSALAT